MESGMVLPAQSKDGTAGEIPASPTKSGVLIINTKSRQGQAWFEQARTHLQNMGVTLNEAIALEEPEKLPQIVYDQIAKGETNLIIGGGDGSFSGTVDYFANKEVTLGVLPLGTVNDFARNLQIPVDVEAACRIIAEGRTARVDLGKANDDYFTITASIGFSAATQKALTPEFKKRLGPFGYVAAGLLAFRHIRPFAITVKSEKGTETLRVVQAGVINGHTWMGGKVTIPNVDLQSGGLAFYAIPAQPNLLAYWRLSRQLTQGHIFQTPDLRAFRTHDVTIEVKRSKPLVVDGDLSGRTPVRMQIAPKALRVFVPASFLADPEDIK